jgi:hypothetical protein
MCVFVCVCVCVCVCVRECVCVCVCVTRVCSGGGGSSDGGGDGSEQGFTRVTHMRCARAPYQFTLVDESVKVKSHVCGVVIMLTGGVSGSANSDRYKYIHLSRRVCTCGFGVIERVAIVFHHVE